MPQEITRTQIEKYTVYTGPTAESFSPTMAGITYPDPAYEILVYRRPLCVFEYVLSGRGHIERNGSILTVNAGDAYILTAGTYHHYYSDKVDPWTKIWFNVSGSLVQHLLSDYGLDGVTLIPRFHNETPLTRILDAFPVPLQAHPPVPGGISCCSLPVLPVPKVQAGPVQAAHHLILQVEASPVKRIVPRLKPPL